MLDIAAESLTKDFGRIRAVDDVSFEIQPAAGGRLARSQRLGQDDDAADAAGARVPDGRPDDDRRSAVCRAERSGPPCRGRPRGGCLSRRPHGAQPSPGAGHRGGHRAPTCRRGPRTRRPDRSSRSPRGHVLARHGPAALAGSRVARRPWRPRSSTSLPTGSIPPVSGGCATSCAALPAKAARSCCPAMCWPRSQQTVDEVLILDRGLGGAHRPMSDIASLEDAFLEVTGQMEQLA